MSWKRGLSLFIIFVFLFIPLAAIADTITRYMKQNALFGRYNKLSVQQLTVGQAATANGVATLNGNVNPGVSVCPPYCPAQEMQYTISTGELVVGNNDVFRTTAYSNGPYPHGVDDYFFRTSVNLAPQTAIANLDVNGDVRAQSYFTVTPVTGAQRSYTITVYPNGGNPYGYIASVDSAGGTDPTSWFPLHVSGSSYPSGLLAPVAGYMNTETKSNNKPVYIGLDPLDPIVTLARNNGYTLTVKGRSIANSWFSMSSRDAKMDIRPLGMAEETSVMNTLKSTPLYHFAYKHSDNSSPKENEIHTGVIAEEAPSQIVNNDKKGLSVSDTIGLLIASIKDIARENGRLEKEITQLEKEMNV